MLTAQNAGSKYGVRYGWFPSAPDLNDFHLSITQHGIVPDEVDNSTRVPEIWNQTNLGACVGFGCSRAGVVAESHEIQPNPKIRHPSTLFVYYNGRALEGTINEDSGLSVRDGMKAIAKAGLCSEADWPYDISKFTIQPPAQAYADGKLERARRYYRVAQTLADLKAVLALGFGIAFGMTVYESFESLTVERTGMVPMPQPGEKALGGHCQCIMGFSEKLHRFIVANSWGPDWGGRNETTATRGYAFIPYELILSAQLSCDYWTIRSVD